MYQNAALGDLPDASPEALSELSRVTEADVDRGSRTASTQSRTRGKLGALLAQFPPSFHDTPANREYLAWLLRTFREYPTAVELRHQYVERQDRRDAGNC